ncbi:MAG: peptide-methionine (S)-S-oxide reductase [Chloroflexi bacterium]|nr:peptide-methionine (S)-S-oxide reductase [Chloroflexota bacterium]
MLRCVEAIFQDYGVGKVVSGYMGGAMLLSPNYRSLGSLHGHSDRTEVIQVTFDGSVVSYTKPC